MVMLPSFSMWGYHHNVTKQKLSVDWNITKGEGTFFIYQKHYQFNPAAEKWGIKLKPALTKMANSSPTVLKR